MNLGKVEIWETSLDRIVTLREGAKGVLRHASSSASYALHRKWISSRFGVELPDPISR